MITQNLSEKQKLLMRAALKLAKACNYDESHTRLVTELALNLFDQLEPLHHLKTRERMWLLYASLLHDIGWVKGQSKHHKNSLDIILETNLLPLENKEKLIIGSIARYHRKALPSLKHDHFAALRPDEREIVSQLAALLRLADGMDHTHSGNTERIACAIEEDKVIISCFTKDIHVIDIDCANEKSDLFRTVYKKNLILNWFRSIESVFDAEQIIATVQD
jgi:exopolyphosphatase/guanosine-5'-triphosphate,3'-diphosphate pyrophosphatase